MACSFILDLVLNLCLSVMLISGYIAGGTLVLGKLLPAGAFVKKSKLCWCPRHAFFWQVDIDDKAVSALV